MWKVASQAALWSGAGFFFFLLIIRSPPPKRMAVCRQGGRELWFPHVFPYHGIQLMLMTILGKPLEIYHGHSFFSESKSHSNGWHFNRGPSCKALSASLHKGQASLGTGKWAGNQICKVQHRYHWSLRNVAYLRIAEEAKIYILAKRRRRLWLIDGIRQELSWKVQWTFIWKYYISFPWLMMLEIY